MSTPDIRAELLALVSAAFDDQMQQFYEKHQDGPEPTMADALEFIFGQSDAEEQIGGEAIARASSVMRLDTEEKVEGNIDTLQFVIQSWLDGFAIGLRYGAGEIPQPITVKEPEGE